MHRILGKEDREIERGSFFGHRVISKVKLTELATAVDFGLPGSLASPNGRGGSVGATVPSFFHFLVANMTGGDISAIACALLKHE